MSLSLTYWWIGFLSYAAFHLLHICVWYGRKIERDVKLLFILLFFIPTAIYFNLVLIAGTASLWSAPFVVHVVLAMNYLAIYPAFHASSPTIHILCFLWKTGRQVSEGELIGLFGRPAVLADRIGDLIRGDLVRSDGEGLSLSPKGAVLANIFLLYRRMLGLPLGAG